VVWSHHACVVDGNIHIELVKLDVLLGERMKRIVDLQCCNSEHWLAIKLGVAKAR
jgi:hypothetical protein